MRCVSLSLSSCLLSSVSSLVVSPFFLLFPFIVPSSLLSLRSFLFFLTAGWTLNHRKAVDLPQRVQFLLLAAVSSTFSNVDVTQPVKKCLKLRKEAKIGRVVEGQRNHHHHMQPSPCIVVCVMLYCVVFGSACDVGCVVCSVVCLV